MGQVIKPSKHYFNIDFENIKTNIKNNSHLIEERDEYIIFGYQKAIVVLHNNLFLVLLNDINNETKYNAIKYVQNEVNKIITDFKFELPDELLFVEIEGVLRKYGKIKGKSRLMFSDRQCINELIKIVR